MMQSYSIVFAILFGIMTFYVSAIDEGPGHVFRKLKSATERILGVEKMHWPHEIFGYTLYHRADNSPDRALSDSSVDFLYNAACGSFLGKVQSIGLKGWNNGFAANTCLLCRSKNETSVQSCKVLVEASSASELSWKLMTYTDADCADNGKSAGSYVWEAGTCYDDSYTYSFKPGITDLSQFGNGLMYVDYHDSGSSCTTQITSTCLIGYYQDYCYCADDSGCISLHYDGDATVTATQYSDKTSCQGESFEYTISNECWSDDGIASWGSLLSFTDDDNIGVYDNTTSTNCFGLDNLGQKSFLRGN